MINSSLRPSYSGPDERHRASPCIGEDEGFLDGHQSALVLDYNLFLAMNLTISCSAPTNRMKEGATVFGYHVKNPRDYGVLGFDYDGRVTSIEEKPDKPQSNFAVTSLYFYDEHAPNYARTVRLSVRPVARNLKLRPSIRLISTGVSCVLKRWIQARPGSTPGLTAHCCRRSISSQL